MTDSSFPIWTSDTETVYTKFNTSLNGLSRNEAEKRLELYSANTITNKNKNTILTHFWGQISSPLVIILLAALVLSFVLKKKEEAIFILTAIIVNIAIGVWQGWKANNAIEKLESYITKQAKVIRDGVLTTINSAHLVLGDIVYIRSGDTIPADLRLVESTSLEVDESLLTGESLSVEKDAHAIVLENAVLSDRTNMLWNGSIATDGDATGIVVQTGNKTELGKIADMVGRTKAEKTPLEKSVTHLARVITIFLLVLGVVIFFLGLADGYKTADILLIAIAVIVSAVPESLPIAMSTVLAVGAGSLAKKKGVVRKIAATETLGVVSLIMTDKTGTLTEGKMRLQHIDSANNNQGELLLEAFQNTGAIENKDGTVSGRPLEIAIYEHCKNNHTYSDLLPEYQIQDTLMFNSTLKYSGVYFIRNNEHIVSFLGAPDILIEKTNLSDIEKNKLNKKVLDLASTGERIVCVVHKKIEIYTENTMAELIHDKAFIFQGLLRFRDNVRESVPQAVVAIQTAGVRVVMVTGDHPGTARAIAEEVGIWKEGDTVLTGSELEKISDTDLPQHLLKTTVFARTTPEQKLRLVNAFSAQGETIAVTGDGVNDAPALKRADIGVAMGSGTDVARASADIVILDDDFNTIVEAIFEGRGILYKMRTVITYLLADSFDELMLVGGSLLVGLVLPLNALQILFVKFFSDIFPAMAFTFEKIDGRKIQRKKRKTSLFDHDVRLFTFVRGFFASMFLFAIYFVLSKTSFDQAIVRTFIFASFSSYMLFIALSMRRLDESIFKYKIFSNYYLTGGLIFGFTSIVLAIYYKPLANILGTSPLPLPWFFGVIGIGFINLGFMEVLKYFNSRTQRHI